jgi:hypothetical protein
MIFKKDLVFFQDCVILNQRTWIRIQIFVESSGPDRILIK